MRKWLYKKTVILSGASGGIGRELAKILIEKYGACVLGIGRSEQKMLSLKQELGENADKFDYRLFDVGEKQGWAELKHEITEKGITPSVLINNAGVFPPFNTALKNGSDVVEKTLKTNFYSAVYAIEEISPVLIGENKPNGKKKHLPAIVNVASAASLCTVVGTSAYSASKAALKGYSEALQLELKGKYYVGIIYPGTTATDLFRSDENTKNSALDYIAMPAKKMAKKIAKKIIKKKKRAVVGWDAKAMNVTAKIAPVKGVGLICGVMKASKSKVFKEVFEYKSKDKS